MNDKAKATAFVLETLDALADDTDFKHGDHDQSSHGDRGGGAATATEERPYIPQGRTDQASYDYTDNPQDLANKFTRPTLVDALEDGVLKFDYEEYVPKEAIQAAIRLHDAGLSSTIPVSPVGPPYSFRDRAADTKHGDHDQSDHGNRGGGGGGDTESQARELASDLGITDEDNPDLMADLRGALAADATENAARTLEQFPGAEDAIGVLNRGGSPEDAYALMNDKLPGTIKVDGDRLSYRVESAAGDSYRITPGVQSAGESPWVLTTSSDRHGIQTTNLNGSFSFADAVEAANYRAENDVKVPDERRGDPLAEAAHRAGLGDMFEAFERSEGR